MSLVYKYFVDGDSQQPPPALKQSKALYANPVLLPMQTDLYV